MAPAQKGRKHMVDGTGHATVQAETRRLERLLHRRSHAPSQDHLRALALQEAREASMVMLQALYGAHGFGEHPAVPHLCDQKRLRAPEMSVDLSINIRYRDDHA